MSDTAKQKIEVHIDRCRVRASGHVVLRDVHFDFSEGDRLTVLGASGAGKSTLMNAILGYLDPLVWEIDGTVIWNGLDLLKLDPVEWAEYRGRDFRTLFQEPARMVHPMFKIDEQIHDAFRTVLPDMEEGKLIEMADKIRHDLRVSRELETMGTYPSEVSGGQLQRIALAISLGPPARFYFADEPANSLDAEITWELIRILKEKLDAKELKALWLITHDINVSISAGCTDVLFLDETFTGHAMPIDKFMDDPGFDYGRDWLETQMRIYESYRTQELTANIDLSDSRTLMQVKDFAYRYPIKGIIYRRGKPVIEEVSFALRRGEFIGLAGNSGAGKSTIGRCLGHIQHDFDGDVIFDSSQITRSKHVPSSVQYLMQDAARSFDPNQKIWENLRQCAEGRRLDWGLIEKEVHDYFEQLGLAADLLNRFPRELSGGQRQRIAFIRSLMGPTELLIADEPFVNLDPIIQLEMSRILREKRKTDPPLSGVLVSHNFGLLAPLCDRIIVLSGGKQIESAQTSDLISNPKHEETRRLIRAAIQLGQIALSEEADERFHEVE
jgi:peptide/nickel transport system ATP-binding protein